MKKLKIIKNYFFFYIFNNIILNQFNFHLNYSNNLFIKKN